MKITEQPMNFENGACGSRQDQSAEMNAGRRTMEVHWAESEFFQVWLKLAREGQEQNRN